jgi:hypothetical protein
MVIVVLCLSATACGGTGNTGAHTRALAAAANTPVSSGRLMGDVDDDDEGTGNRTPTGVTDKDADLDNDSPTLESKAYHDADDRVIVTWGRAADKRDRLAVAAVIGAYYQAAVAGNASKACSLIYTLFAEAIPEDYGQPPGPPSLRGSTCEAVLTKFFHQEHAKFASEAASLRVTGVRVKEKQGRALLGFTTAPAAYLDMQKERGNWRLVGLLGATLP